MGRRAEKPWEVRDAWNPNGQREAGPEEGRDDTLVWVGIALGIVAVVIALLFALSWWIGPQ